MYYSETQKIRPKIEKYLVGRMIDVGCGSDKVHSDAVGVDVRMLPGVDHVTARLANLSEWIGQGKMKDPFDVVYSSHCLEHFKEDMAALNDWYKLLNDGGVMILYLPDDDYYDNDSNPEHVHKYCYAHFVNAFTKNFINRMTIIEHGLDIGFDKYSFFLVAKKVDSELVNPRAS